MWWRHLLPGRREQAAVDGVRVVRVVGPLDSQSAPGLSACLDQGRHRVEATVRVELGGCDFVDARGFRALLRLQEEVRRRAGRMLVVDPPHTLRTICRAAPGRLDLAPGTGVPTVERARP